MLINKNNQLYLKPDWPAPAEIQAYCTTGLNHFNVASHVNDSPKQVAINRQRLQQDLHLPPAISYLNQTHSNRAIALPTHEEFDADASYSQQAKQVCVVLTADCLPILICNRAGNEVAAIHAGWRGLAHGVIENTLAKLISPAHELMAWIGPALSQPHFEVGAEVKAEFPGFDEFFVLNHRGRWQMDFIGICRRKLQQLGLSEIYGGDYCSFASLHEQQPLFFSYRRCQGQTGRMASLIWIA